MWHDLGKFAPRWQDYLASQGGGNPRPRPCRPGHQRLVDEPAVRRFFVRWKGAIHHHVFCSLRAFLKLEHRRFTGQTSSWYQFKRHFADQAITAFIQQTVKHPHSA